MSNTFRGNRHDVREYTRLGSRRTSGLGRVEMEIGSRVSSPPQSLRTLGLVESAAAEDLVPQAQS